MYNIKTGAGAKGGSKMLVTGRFGFVGGVDSVLGGVIDSGGGGDGQDRDNNGRLLKWEDTVANITLGKEHNAPLAYALGLEHHHMIMSTLGYHGSQLERDREMFVGGD